MKKVLLTLLLGAFAVMGVQAQCVPDTTITQVIMPPAGSKIDSVNNIVILPYAYVGQPYAEVMHFRVPKDTNFFGSPIPINYVQLDTILGLPSSLVLSCTPDSCKFAGGDFGCAQMTGTPLTADSVELRIAIEYNVTVSGLPTPIKDTLGGYYLVIKAGAVGLEETNLHHRVPRLYPNPVQDELFLDYYAEQGSSATLKITSITGATVYQKTSNAEAGVNEIAINTANFKPGVYMYNFQIDTKNYSGRFSISR